jgi:predicted metal-dependent enzyme (double-stranded beta helix superfamily)
LTTSTIQKIEPLNHQLFTTKKKTKVESHSFFDNINPTISYLQQKKNKSREEKTRAIHFLTTSTIQKIETQTFNLKTKKRPKRKKENDNRKKKKKTVRKIGDP